MRVSPDLVGLYCYCLRIRLILKSEKRGASAGHHSSGQKLQEGVVRALYCLSLMGMGESEQARRTGSQLGRDGVRDTKQTFTWKIFSANLLQNRLFLFYENEVHFDR